MSKEKYASIYSSPVSGKSNDRLRIHREKISHSKIKLSRSNPMLKRNNKVELVIKVGHSIFWAHAVKIDFSKPIIDQLAYHSKNPDGIDLACEYIEAIKNAMEANPIIDITVYIGNIFNQVWYQGIDNTMKIVVSGVTKEEADLISLLL